MSERSTVSSNAESTPIPISCVFCQQTDIDLYVLKETSSFRLVTDHAPLVEGHLLIMPKAHYACYGEVPATFDQELFSLKREVQQFFNQFYDPPIFWEHGVFRQTVFHAHLHCFPFGALNQHQFALCHQLSAKSVHSQNDLRNWYTSRGYYFYLEPGEPFLFAPETETYVRVIQDILWSKASEHNQQRAWHSTEQRRLEAAPLLASTFTKWHTFQHQGNKYANSTHTTSTR